MDRESLGSLCSVPCGLRLGSEEPVQSDRVAKPGRVATDIGFAGILMAPSNKRRADVEFAEVLGGVWGIMIGLPSELVTISSGDEISPKVELRSLSYPAYMV